MGERIEREMILPTIGTYQRQEVEEGDPYKIGEKMTAGSGSSAPQPEQPAEVPKQAPIQIQQPSRYNSAIQNETAEIHSESEVKKVLEPIFKKYNLVYSTEFVSKLCWQNDIKTLLNLLDKDDRFKKALKRLEISLDKALEKHFDPKTKTVNLDKVTETAIEYKRAMIFGGWNSIEDYENAKKVYTHKDGKPFTFAEAILGKGETFKGKSEKEIKKAVTDYLDRKFEKFLNDVQKECKEPELAKMKAAYLLRQHISILMLNSSDEEKSYLNITVMNCINESEQLNEYFNSIKDPKFREKVADDFFNAGELMKMDKEYIEIIVSNMSGQKVKELDEISRAQLRELIELHKQELASAIEKTKAGKELTSDEATYLEQFEKLTGVRIGIINNTNVKEDTNAQINEKWEEQLQKYEPIYQYHLEEIKRFVEQHADSLNMPVEKFESLIEEYTNGKYSEITSPPERTAESSDGLGYNIPDPERKDEAQKRADYLLAGIIPNNEEQTPVVVIKEGKRTETTSSESESTGIIPFFTSLHQLLTNSDESEKELAKKVLTGEENFRGSAIENWALNVFTNMNPEDQLKTWVKAAFEYSSKLRDYAQSWTLLAVAKGDVIFGSSQLTKMNKESSKEIMEKKGYDPVLNEGQG